MGQIGVELVVGPDEEEPRTLPGPLNMPKEEEEEVKGLFTFFMNPFILSFMSSISDWNSTIQLNSIQSKMIWLNESTNDTKVVSLQRFEKLQFSKEGDERRESRQQNQ